MSDTFIWVGTADSTTTTTAGGWNVAANWLKNGAASGTLPQAGDWVSFENGTQDIAVGPNTNSSTIVYLGSLSFAQSWTGKTPADGLNVGAAQVNIGQQYGGGSPAGSPRIQLNLTPSPITTNASHSSQITVFNTASASQDANREPVRIVCNNASTRVEVRKGRVGVATNCAGQTAVLSSVAVGPGDGGSAPYVNVGAGVTLSTYRQNGGQNVLQCAAGTVDVQGGELTIRGSGSVSSLGVSRGGTVYPESTGGVGQLSASGTVDFNRSAAARTVDGVTLYSGSAFKADRAFVTITTGTSQTNNLKLQSCTLADVTLDLGVNPVIR